MNRGSCLHQTRLLMALVKNLSGKAAALLGARQQDIFLPFVLSTQAHKQPLRHQLLCTSSKWCVVLDHYKVLPTHLYLL